MGQPKLSRRERLRAETAAEIKAVALRHMATGGAAAISLRAIARDMGMTAGAIYSYYDTRDALINALITDVYNSLADTLEAAVLVIFVLIALGLAEGRFPQVYPGHAVGLYWVA
ncbi:TetR/AcrR family transcriptional regulator, partial [Streptomyces sp. NPDC050804]|uniref:TetR/AcrR family transcriptional regulator n=1 Tax=Streptomyces sp. NPDC050804 TaxID=3154745 RepID=UPI00344413E1